MDHPNRDDFDEKVIGSRKRKMNLVQHQKNVDTPSQEKEVPQQSSGAFSGITKWLTGGKSDALEGFGGPPVVEVVYEPKGGDDDFLSSIGSPRSEKDFLSSINSGDEALLTSGDEFMSCASDNDEEERLKNVVSDIEEESVGSKKRKQSKPSQHVAVTPVSAFRTFHDVEDDGTGRSSNMKSDESDSSFVTPENSWYDGDSTPPTVVRKTVVSPSKGTADASGTPIGKDTSPKEFSKVVTEKTVRREFDGRNIRKEFSHTTTEKIVRSGHKETTEKVIHKSSHEGTHSLFPGGGIATAFKDAFNVAAAGSAGHTPAVVDIASHHKTSEGTSAGSDIAATVKDMFNNVAAVASHVLGTAETEKVTGISSALKGMSNIAAIVAPPTQISKDIPKDVPKVTGISAALKGMSNIAAVVSPTQISKDIPKDDPKVPCNVSAGISSALKGISNVAAVASPLTHVSCEIRKGNTVAKDEGKVISSVAARIQNISNQHMKITPEVSKNQKAEIEIHASHTSSVTKSMVSDNTSHQVHSAGNVSVVGGSFVPVTKDEIKMTSVPITFILKETNQAPVNVTAGSFTQTSKDNIKITGAYSMAPLLKDQIGSQDIKQNKEAVVSSGHTGSEDEIKITGAYSIAHIPKNKINTAACAATTAISVGTVYGHTEANNGHPCGSNLTETEPNIKVSCTTFSATSQSDGTVTHHANVGAEKTSVSKEIKLPANPSAPITFVLTDAAKAKITQEMNASSNVIARSVVHMAKATAVPVTSVLKEMVQSKVSKTSNHSGQTNVTTHPAPPITFVLKDTAKVKVTELAKEKDEGFKKCEEIVDFTIENVRSLQSLSSLGEKSKNGGTRSSTYPAGEDMDMNTENKQNIDSSMDFNESISSPTTDEYEGRDKRKHKRKRRTSPVYPIVYSKRKRKRDCVLLHEIYKQNIDFIMSPPPAPVRQKVELVRNISQTIPTATVATSSISKSASKTDAETPVKKNVLKRKVDTAVKKKILKEKVVTITRRSSKRIKVKSTAVKKSTNTTKTTKTTKSTKKRVKVSTTKVSKKKRKVISTDPTSSKKKGKVKAKRISSKKSTKLASKVKQRKVPAKSSSKVTPKKTPAKSSTKVTPKKKPAKSLTKVTPKKRLAKSSSKVTQKKTPAKSSSKVTPKKTPVMSTPLRKAKAVTTAVRESSGKKKAVTPSVKSIAKKKVVSSVLKKARSRQVRFADAKSPTKKKAVVKPVVAPTISASTSTSGALTAFMKQSPGFRGGALTAFMKRPDVAIEESNKGAAFTAIKSISKKKKATFTAIKSPSNKKGAPPTPEHGASLRGKYNETDRLRIGKYASEHGIQKALLKYKVKYTLLKYPTVQVFRNRYWLRCDKSKKNVQKKSKSDGSKNPTKRGSSASVTKSRRLVIKAKVVKGKVGGASTIKSRRLVDKARIVKAKARVAKARRQSKEAKSTPSRQSYTKYTERERLKIGKYASKHGDLASAKKFMASSNLRVSTVHRFKNLYKAANKGSQKSSKTEAVGTKRRRTHSSTLKSPSQIKVESPAPKTFTKIIKVESPAPKRSTRVKVDTPVASQAVKKEDDAEHPWKFVTRSQRYQCQICGQQLKQKKHFKYHMMIHTEEKPHECRTCGLRTRSKSNLNRHMKRIHPDQGKHQCKKCRQTFKSFNSLTKHVKTQKCKKCK